MSSPQLSPDSPRCWLLLRGLAREQRHWGEFPQVLLQTLGAEKVLCLDLPGTGSEHWRVSPGSISAIMEDVRQRWLEVRGEGASSWGVIAISLGGMVAQDWASRHPEDFKAVVLINSSAASGSWPWQRIRPAAFFGALRMLFVSDALKRERVVLRLTTRLLPDREVVARKWADFARERPARPGSALAQLFAAARFIPPRNLACPVLVIRSEQDGFTDPHCSLVLARRLCAASRAHTRAGHDLPLDDPRWLASEIAHWSRREVSGSFSCQRPYSGA